MNKNTYYQALIETPLGPMLAIADDNVLYVLEFVDSRGLEKKLERFRLKVKATIVPGYSQPIAFIESELKEYFSGDLTDFKTPIFLLGTPFQKNAWKELLKIPVGETCSYSDIAHRLKKPTAFRAVAQALGANRLAIIIPCHRVISLDGGIGGYAGGLTRKEYLLALENRS